jgi:CheY-like chemotaxis protein
VGLATADGAASSPARSEASELARAVLSKIQPTGREGMEDAEGRLLVVDDNAMNRDLLSRQLARKGYIVLTASDGAEALELLRSQTVDLILLDVFMPGMDGVETLRRLKADERLQEIPVLMISSLDEMDGALRCIEMGAEDYLSKPVKPAILEVRIAANLELSRMRERERAYEERLAADEGFIGELLRSAFPEGIAEQVKGGNVEVVDGVAEATVLSCQVRGLTASPSSSSLSQRVKALRAMGAAVETLAGEHGVETVIWRPDGFLAVAGAPSPTEDHAERAGALGRAFLASASAIPGPDGGPLRIGLGLHIGSVAAAALGGDRLRYEVWGEGVKTAESVAEAAPDGALLASPPVHARLRERFSFQSQKVRDIAGVQMRTYLLLPDVDAGGG